jgi:hypothetical protein
MKSVDVSAVLAELSPLCDSLKLGQQWEKSRTHVQCLLQLMGEDHREIVASGVPDAQPSICATAYLREVWHELPWKQELLSPGVLDRYESPDQETLRAIRNLRTRLIEVLGATSGNGLPDLVTSADVAEMVGVEEMNLTPYRKHWPDAVIPHRGQRAAQYDYRNLYPLLKKQFPDNLQLRQPHL